MTQVPVIDISGFAAGDAATRAAIAKKRASAKRPSRP
jgi:hypothetical protein